MNNYELTIGIEIHIELNTKTKMFSPAENNFNAAPNTLVHPIDVAYPGTLPQLNKQAIIKAIKLAKALQMEIDPLVRFDRKNYFYPDLPKGFQITQFFHPIGQKGILPIKNELNQIKHVEINRIHMEEDTAKQIHQNEFTFLNFNRAGVPLIEIVTEPVLSSATEAANYVEMIKNVALFLDISDAKMAEGSLRADINLSIRPKGQQTLGTKVEIKNLNSIANIKKAIEFEQQLQIKKLENNENIIQQTKRFDENLNQTVVMRDKTGEVDYKYMPEPNIPFIRLENELINNVEIPKLPWEIEKEFLSNGIDQEYINQLINDIELLKIFNNINFSNKYLLSKMFFNELVSIANKNKVHLKELDIDYAQFKKALQYLEKEKISGKHFKIIIQELVNDNNDVDTIIKNHKMELISDQNIIKDLLNKIIEKNPISLDEYKNRPERTNKLILGLLMKETNGQVNPVIAAEILNDILKGSLDEKN